MFTRQTRTLIAVIILLSAVSVLPVDGSKKQVSVEEMYGTWVNSLYNVYSNRPISAIIREAVSDFVRKKDHPLSIVATYLPKASKDQGKNITAYFPNLTGIL